MREQLATWYLHFDADNPLFWFWTVMLVVGWNLHPVPGVVMLATLIYHCVFWFVPPANAYLRRLSIAAGWLTGEPPTQVDDVDDVAADSSVQGGDAELWLHDMRPDMRQHTLIAARPGDGKTTALNVLLVADIASGAQVVVLNPQFAHFHAEDQPIDLRPLREHFQVMYAYEDIRTTLEALHRHVEARNVLYREGKDVGHVISVLIDEWPSIVDSDAGKDCTTLVRKIVREARKCKVFVTLAAQDGQVSTLNMSGGVRSSFKTCLVGNVDKATWKALIGDTPHLAVQFATWASERGVIHVEPPDSQTITDLADDKPSYSGAKISKPACEFRNDFRDFSALESREKSFEISLEPHETARITAMIVRKRNQTEVVRAIPNYRADRHAEYVTFYNRLKEAIDEHTT